MRSINNNLFCNICFPYYYSLYIKNVEIGELTWDIYPVVTTFIISNLTSVDIEYANIEKIHGSLYHYCS